MWNLIGNNFTHILNINLSMLLLDILHNFKKTLKFLNLSVLIRQRCGMMSSITAFYTWPPISNFHTFSLISILVEIILTSTSALIRSSG